MAQGPGNHLVRGERAILEQIARGADLAATLTSIVRLVEAHSEGMIATILLVDAEGRVHSGAAPSLPAWFAQAVEGEPIGPEAGSCGTAAFLRKPVTTADIAHDPLWHRYRALAEKAGLASSWSVPLFAPTGEVLGTLAHYYHTPRDPSPHDLELTDVARYLAEIAIWRKRTDQDLADARLEAERRAEAALDMVAAARELDRLRAMFVNAVSHELRTPLTNILGYVELLEDGVGGELAERQRGFARNIVHNALRLRRLVDDLLDHARFEAGTFRLELQGSDAAALLREVVDSLQLQADAAGVTLELDVPEEPMLLEMDPRRIEQVLANLITNALKFTTAGGNVRVSARSEPGWIRVEVVDSGIGIEPDQIARLFRPFGQLEAGRTRGGTGLGLMIAKSIVEAHGGTIDVHSTPRVGSTFGFRLPR